MRTVIVDTEGTGLHPDDGARISAIGIGWWDDDFEWKHVMHPFGQSVELNSEEKADAGRRKWDELLDRLSQRRLVFHNGKYDLHMLAAGSVTGHPGVDLSEAFAWDTMVGQRLIDPVDKRGVKPEHKGIGLKPSARRLFEAPDWDSELAEILKKTKPRKRYDLVAWSDMQPYLAGDLFWTGQLLLSQIARIMLPEDETNPPPSSIVFERWMEITRFLFRIEERGVRYRWEESAAAADNIEAVMETLAAELPFVPTPRKAGQFFISDGAKQTTIEQVAEKFDITIPDNFAERDKLIERWITPTGLPKMDDGVRKELIARGVEHIETYDHWCWLETAQSMWYRSWADKTNKVDGRLRTNYRQTKVVSGRFSCERAQLMAIPHDHQLKEYGLPEGTPMVREFLEAPPGWEWQEVDVSQAEVRVGAVMADCQAMLDALRAGADPHGTTTRMVFNIEDPGHPKVWREPSSYKDPNGHTVMDPGGWDACSCDECAEWFHMRQIGKRLTLATVYDAGALTLKEQLKIFANIDSTLDECRGYLAAFRRPFPEFKQACYRAQSFGEKHGYVPLVRGERRYFQWFEIPPHKAFNQRVQGSVAVLMNCAGVRISQELPDVRVLLQTHDSFLIEQRPGADDAERVSRIMVKEFTDECQIPFECDIKPWRKS